MTGSETGQLAKLRRKIYSIDLNVLEFVCQMKTLDIMKRVYTVKLREMFNSDLLRSENNVFLQLNSRCCFRFNRVGLYELELLEVGPIQKLTLVLLVNSIHSIKILGL